MLALLIDPELKIIQPVEVGNRHDIYAVLRCATVQLVMLSETEGLYVDEDGLLVDDPGPFFDIRGNQNNPFAGRGLVIGLDSHGRDVDTKIKADDLIRRITFPNIELVGFEPISGTLDISGQRVQMVGSRAVFRKRNEGH